MPEYENIPQNGQPTSLLKGRGTQLSLLVAWWMKWWRTWDECDELDLGIIQLAST